MKKQIKKYPNGGQKAGQFLGNWGAATADIALSTLGLNNVVPDSAYQGGSAQDFRNISNVGGGITKTALPMIANIVAPGSGQFIKMGQQAVGSFNPNYGGDEQSNGFAYGGQMNGSQVELEKQEVFQTPQGQVNQVNGPNHSNGGVNVNLPENSRIFSDRLKTSRGKTYAEEAGQFTTDKWQKQLDTSKNEFSRNTAKRMMEITNKKLDTLFQEQETYKMKKGLTNDGKKFDNGGKVKPKGSYTYEQYIQLDPFAKLAYDNQFSPPEQNPSQPASNQFFHKDYNSQGGFMGLQTGEWGTTPAVGPDTPQQEVAKPEVKTSKSTSYKGKEVKQIEGTSFTQAYKQAKQEVGEGNYFAWTNPKTGKSVVYQVTPSTKQETKPAQSGTNYPARNSDLSSGPNRKFPNGGTIENPYYGVNINQGMPQPIQAGLEQVPVYDPPMNLPQAIQPAYQTPVQKTWTDRFGVIHKGVEPRPAQYQAPRQFSHGGTNPPLNLQTGSVDQMYNDYANGFPDPTFNPLNGLSYEQAIDVPLNTSLNRLDPEFGPGKNQQIPVRQAGLPSDFIDPNSVQTLPSTERGTPFLDAAKNRLAKVDPNYAAASIGNFIGPAYDIMRGLKGGDDVNFDRLNPSMVDYSQSRNLTTKNLNSSFRDTRKAIQEGTGGGAGNYLANVSNAAYNRDTNIRDNNTRSIEAEQNTNAGIRNQAGQFNAQTQKEESIARQQEKDVASNVLSKGLYNAGSATSQLGVDNQRKAYDPIIRELIATGDYRYTYSPKGQIVGVVHIPSNKETKLAQ